MPKCQRLCCGNEFSSRIYNGIGWYRDLVSPDGCRKKVDKHEQEDTEEEEHQPQMDSRQLAVVHERYPEQEQPQTLQRRTSISVR